MAGLRDKLRRLTPAAPAAAPAARPPTAGMTLHSERFAPEDPWGYPAADLAGVDLNSLCRFCCGRGVDSQWDRVAFIDTETTGLAGSATAVFLLGIGRLDPDGGLTVRQAFMEDYDGEEALMDFLEQQLADVEVIVSFNGKSFDVPQLKTRQILLGRRGYDWDRLVHMDLLHPARAVWKLRLARSNLTHLERALLGVAREGDVDGAEIPGRYFAYLQDRDFAPMAEILQHNRWDIRALVALCVRLGRALQDPGTETYPEDLYSLGRAMGRRKRFEDAADCYLLAQRGSVTGAARLELSLIYKRQGAYEQAARLWRQMIQSAQGGLAPYEELAKYYEHRLKDPDRALAVTNQALRLIARVGGGQTAALDRRKARLEEKLTRQREKERFS